MKHVINFNKLSVGQVLWDIRFGNVTVLELNHSTHYPILIKNKGNVYYSYTKDGRSNLDDHLIVLFLFNPKNVREFPKLMEVRNNEHGDWVKRIVVFKTGYGVVALWNLTNLDEIDQARNASLYEHFREIEESEIVELTIKEIADKFNLPVENVRIKDK